MFCKTITYNSYEYNLTKTLLQKIDNPTLLKPKGTFLKSNEVVLRYEITFFSGTRGGRRPSGSHVNLSLEPQSLVDSPNKVSINFF